MNAELLAASAALVMAGVLLWAALEKLRAPRSIRATLEGLGLSGKLARGTAVLLAAVELTVALGLLFRPSALAVQAGVALLALAFAFAGLVAIGRDEPIPCSCFGAAGGGRLGVAQVILVVPWLVAVALLHVGSREPLPLTDGAARLAAVGLGLAFLRSISVASAWREARGDRLSAREMYRWLQ
ncbi:MAG: hypothetical protein MI919_16615 [Holophagales bacterium]|nr:hypothetical protein [Holophagales bacterium]